jgi:chaperonin cofactor prefoldin
MATSNDDFGKYQLEAMLPNMEMILKEVKKIEEEVVVFYAA